MQPESPITSDYRRAPTVQFPAPRSILRTRFRKMHEMATILVGPAQVKFMLHTEMLITASPFFAAALEGHFAESSSQTVTLPEEKPEMFEWFVQWLYTGSLMVAGPTNCAPPEHEPAIGARRPQEPIKRFNVHESHSDGDLRNSQGSPKYFLLIDLYALSDRLLTTSLSNHIIDTVARLSETTNSVPTPSDTWLLYGDCCSFSSLHHCACMTRRTSVVEQVPPPAMEPDMEMDAEIKTMVYTPPTSTVPCNKPNKTPQACPHATSSNIGIRPSSPLRDLVLDLFTYKKTDRLLQTHRDDWHPLFLRDLVVKLKRPGRDMIARHRMRDWRPRTWPDAKACEGCRTVVGPAGGTPTAFLAQMSRTPPPPPPTGNRGGHATTTARLRLRAAAAAAAAVTATPLGPERESATGAPDEGAPFVPGPADAAPFVLRPLRCTVCDRVYCVDCLLAAVEGRGLENGDAKFALTGGDVGPCKPWLNWEDLFGDRDEVAAREEGVGVKGVERGPKGGVCGRYHEHGMMGGRMELD